MSAPDEAVQSKVAQWLAYGDEELRLARHGLTLANNPPFRLIAYHAQQCAEKYLKRLSRPSSDQFPIYAQHFSASGVVL